jgi:hypothetical protein
MSRKTAPLLSLVRPVVLITKGGKRQALDHNKAVLGALMAGIACDIEFVVTGGEFLEVLGLDRLLQIDGQSIYDALTHTNKITVLVPSRMQATETTLELD